MTSIIFNMCSETLTYWPIMGHSVHTERQFFFWVLVEIFSHRKCLGNHLALLDPFGFVVTLASYPDTGERKLI